MCKFSAFAVLRGHATSRDEIEGCHAFYVHRQNRQRLLATEGFQYRHPFPISKMPATENVFWVLQKTTAEHKYFQETLKNWPNMLGIPIKSIAFGYKAFEDRFEF